MTPFAGIPDAAFEFYAELEHNNNRDWWLEHKSTYDSAVKEPLTGLLAELEPEFGTAKLFRPNRDIRFSLDKSPYKTAQGAVASVAEGMGFYSSSTPTACSSAAATTPTHRPSWRASAAPWTHPSSGEVLQKIVGAGRGPGLHGGGRDA